MPTPQLIFGG